MNLSRVPEAGKDRFPFPNLLRQKKAMVSPNSSAGVYPNPVPHPRDRRRANRRQEDHRLPHFQQERSRRLQSLLELGRLINLDLKLEPLPAQIVRKTAEMVKGDRCRYLSEKEVLCPGKISLCRFGSGPEDCAAEGGSLFTLTFSLPAGEYPTVPEAGDSVNSI